LKTLSSKTWSVKRSALLLLLRIPTSHLEKWNANTSNATDLNSSQKRNLKTTTQTIGFQTDFSWREPTRASSVPKLIQELELDGPQLATFSIKTIGFFPLLWMEKLSLTNTKKWLPDSNCKLLTLVMFKHQLTGLSSKSSRMQTTLTLISMKKK
jgi:hypothetical protein